MSTLGVRIAMNADKKDFEKYISSLFDKTNEGSTEKPDAGDNSDWYKLEKMLASK